MKITLIGPPDDMLVAVDTALQYLKKYAGDARAKKREGVLYAKPSGEVKRIAWGTMEHVRVESLPGEGAQHD